MGRTNDDEIKAKTRSKKITTNQLKIESKISQNFFGKPSFDILIDDKSFSFRKNWLEIFQKI